MPGTSGRLQEIAERLRADDRRLARRLACHRVRLRGLGVAHPWVRHLLAALTLAGVAAAAVVLMGAGLEAHRPALDVVGALVMAPIPFAPLLWARLRATTGRTSARRARRRQR